MGPGYLSIEFQIYLKEKSPVAAVRAVMSSMIRNDYNKCWMILKIQRELPIVNQMWKKSSLIALFNQRYKTMINLLKIWIVGWVKVCFKNIKWKLRIFNNRNFHLKSKFLKMKKQYLLKKIPMKRSLFSWMTYPNSKIIRILFKMKLIKPKISRNKIRLNKTMNLRIRKFHHFKANMQKYCKKVY